MPVLPDQKTLELPYRWNDTDGLVRVEFGVNDDPDRFGGEAFARGFPRMRASIEPPASGYKQMIGWTQLTERSDQGGRFEIDQFEPLGEVPNPFTVFGYSPLFFDCPHTTLADWDFFAHTFLCGIGGTLFDQIEGKRREVRAVLGFSWGFEKRGSQIDSLEPQPLSDQDWDRHGPYLGSRFSEAGWTFAPGFFDHPLP
ncbi:MAG TPA: hypothetical protein VFN92_05790 [Solirubrobacterales bacterium]|nr:hypothetical protein [Solirubrobacterales bacterium]